LHVRPLLPPDFGNGLNGGLLQSPSLAVPFKVAPMPRGSAVDGGFGWSPRIFCFGWIFSYPSVYCVVSIKTKESSI
jgi:hypothetical protein